MKDNRLLPAGWSPTGPDPSLNGEFLEATFPKGEAERDPDYRDGKGSDTVTYRIQLPPDVDPKNVSVQARLFYQSIPPYYLNDRFTAAKGDATRRLYYLTSNVNLAVDADGRLEDRDRRDGGVRREVAGDRSRDRGSGIGASRVGLERLRHADTGARVCERGAFGGDERPRVAGLAERQLQHAPSAVVADLAVRLDLHERVERRTACAHDEFTDAADRICGARRRLWREPLVACGRGR